MMNIRNLIIEQMNKTRQMFYSENNIDEDNLNWLGRGDFGNAYSIGDGRVLKITTSKSEFEIAKEIIQNKGAAALDGFAEIYVAEEVDGKMMIIMEELDTDSSIEDMYYELDGYLSEYGLPIQYLDNLDLDELDLDEKMLNFISDVSNIVRSYRYLGIEASDIRPENMGYGKDGTIKAFDIEDRKRN